MSPTTVLNLALASVISVLNCGSKELVKAGNLGVQERSDLITLSASAKNDVEVNGIRFQVAIFNTPGLCNEHGSAVIPVTHTIQIPQKSGNAIYSGICLRATNSTSNPIRLSRYIEVTPILITPSGKTAEVISRFFNGAANPGSLGSVKLMPGEAINLMTGLNFYKDRKGLQVMLASAPLDTTFLVDPESGIYQLHLVIENDLDEVNAFPPKKVGDFNLKPIEEQKVSRQIWKGKAILPFLRFQLIR